MLAPLFVAHLVVRHRRRVPSPVLPINYTYFLAVTLPHGTVTLPMTEQLRAAKTATARRRAYPFTGPFGPIVAFEYRVAPRYSIYLDPEGDFG